MSDAFDPFHRWLGIPPKDQPPHHYRLLGIDLFESDPGVIESATDRQMSHVRTFQSGPHSRQSQEMLNLLSGAKICLLNPQRKLAYDQALRTRLPAAQPTTQTAQPARQPASLETLNAMLSNVDRSPYNLAPPATQPVVFQQPAVSRNWQTPPPVPATIPDSSRGLRTFVLIASLAGLAFVLVSAMGWLVWSRMNRLNEEQLAAKQTTVEPSQQPSPTKPKTSTSQPNIPKPKTAPVVAPSQLRVQPSANPAAPNPFQSTPIIVPPPQLPIAKPTVIVVKPAPVQPAQNVAALRPQNLGPPPESIYTGLTHWWGLHETIGNRRDQIGGKDLAERRRVGSAPGILGVCAHFSDSYLQVKNDPSLQINGSTTIAFWVRFSTMNTSNAQQNSHSMVGKWSVYGGHDYLVCYNYLREIPNRFEFLVWEAAENRQQNLYSSASADIGPWYFVVCIYSAEAGLVGISVNNGKMDTMQVARLAATSSPLYVGGDHGPPFNKLHGDMALMGMWNRVLTPDEISALYNNGAGFDLGEMLTPK